VEYRQCRIVAEQSASTGNGFTSHISHPILDSPGILFRSWDSIRFLLPNNFNYAREITHTSYRRPSEAGHCVTYTANKTETYIRYCMLLSINSLQWLTGGFVFIVACDECRARKSRCDGIRPTCQSCAFHNVPCIYEVPKVKANVTKE
jgi:hypothetical protein